MDALVGLGEEAEAEAGEVFFGVGVLDGRGTFPPSA